MKCERCKIEEANVHLKQILGSNVLSLNLCAKCAMDVGIGGENSGEVNLLAAMEMIAKKIGLNHFPKLEGDPFPDPGQAGIECSGCGLTGEEFAKTGLLGCPGCYDAFSQKLEQTFRNLHRDTVHRGRTLQPTENKQCGPGIELAQLHEELTRAIAMEAYEEAADIRDRILKIQQMMQEEQQV